MDDMLKNIIEIDKQARKKVEELEQYRLDAFASLNEQKEIIAEEENTKALESAKRKSDRRKAEGEKYLKAVQLKNKKILENMEALYKENGEKWADDIFKQVISD